MVINSLNNQENKQILSVPIIQNSYNDVFSFPNLIEAGYDSLTGVRWKRSVKNFENNLYANVALLHEQLMDRSYKSRGFHRFTISERGKIRVIHSVNIYERVVQKALCNYGLKPAIIPRLIHTNCASLPGKGTSFAINQLKQDLVRAYSKYGKNCYILTTDYHAYYDSIIHALIIDMIDRYVLDKNLVDISAYFISNFTEIYKPESPSVSNISVTNENQVETVIPARGILNRYVNYDMDYNINQNPFIHDDSTELSCGLGLGSEISQVAAIMYVNPIDHAIKEKYKIEGYTRYMDDSYLIDHDPVKLKECMAFMIEASNCLGLTYNPKHTNFVPRSITEPFTFLKKKVYVKEPNGKIIVKLNQDALTKHNRIIRDQYKLLQDGRIDVVTAFESFYCWRQSVKQFDSRTPLKDMSNRFLELFGSYLNDEQRMKIICF